MAAGKCPRLDRTAPKLTGTGTNWPARLERPKPEGRRSQLEKDQTTPERTSERASSPLLQQKADPSWIEKLAVEKKRETTGKPLRRKGKPPRILPESVADGPPKRSTSPPTPPSTEDVGGGQDEDDRKSVLVRSLKREVREKSRERSFEKSKCNLIC